MDGDAQAELARFRDAWRMPVAGPAQAEAFEQAVLGAVAAAEAAEAQAAIGAELAAALESGHWLATRALEALRAKGADGLRALLARDDSSPPLAAARALLALGLHVAEAEQAIAEALRPPHRTVHAVMAGGACRSPAVADALFAALDDPDELVRHHAFRSLLEVLGLAPSPDARPFPRLAAWITGPLACVRARAVAALRAHLRGAPLGELDGPLVLPHEDGSPAFARLAARMAASAPGAACPTAADADGLSPAERAWVVWTCVVRLGRASPERPAPPWAAELLQHLDPPLAARVLDELAAEGR